jgi:class 3 adenylate cyclase
MPPADPTEGRVETLTVMFTDLVGSTALRVRLGEEEAERLRDRHDELVRAGVLNQRGRIVKHTGDGVMAAFDGAADAIAAAVAIQQELEAHNRRRPDGALQDALAVRIGISVGDVTLEGDDCFGLPVVEAQRLESAAQPGQILVSSLVSALARGRGGHQLRSVGALELKGLEGPLEAQEVLWVSLVPETVALPPALVQRGEFPFSGRAKEAELLVGAFSVVSTGGTRVVLVCGEPGIGKTRLAAEVANAVANLGGAILAGRCDEMVGAPYQPFREALSFQLSQHGGAAMLGSVRGELVRLLPELGSVVPGLPPPLSADPDAERLLLFQAVASWLSEVAADRPVLLVLDDLHWADMGTLLLLRHLVANQPVPRLLVVGTYRDTDLDRAHPLSGMLGELRRRAEVSRISLDGLEAAEVTELVAGAAGHELHEEGVALALALEAETGGNPFFISEVLRHLVESGAIVATDGRWQAAGSTQEPLLPEGIKEVVGKRISALPEATQQALTAASVIGVDFDLEVLATVTDTDEDDLIDALGSALGAHLVAETGVGRYRFAHALVRSTLHEELSTTRRARLHRSVAEAIASRSGADLDAVVPDLAYHWAEAGPAVAAEQAITYASRAGELAMVRVAPEEAARWYGQARDLLGDTDPVRDAELACRQAVALSVSGDPAWHDSLMAAARASLALGDVGQMADSLCISRRMVLAEGSPEAADPEKIELLERAIELCPKSDHGLWARLSAALAGELVYTGDRERRQAIAEAVTAYARTLSDPVERLRVLMTLVAGRPSSNRTRAGADEFLATATQAADALVDRPEPDDEGHALRACVALCTQTGRPEWRHYYERLGEAVARYPHPLHEDAYVLDRMTLAFMEGRIADGEAATVELQRQWSSHGRAAEAQIQFMSGMLQSAREKAGLEPLIGALLALPMNTEAKPNGIQAIVTLALVQAGRAEEARARVDSLGIHGFTDIPDDAALPVSECFWAEALAGVGDEGSRQIFLERMLRYAGLHQATGGWYLGSNARYLALLADSLGRHGEADDWFAQAESDHEQMGSPTWLARGLVDWAESRRRRRQGVEARALATKALQVIGDLELNVSRARAEGILAL